MRLLLPLLVVAAAAGCAQQTPPAAEAPPAAIVAPEPGERFVEAFPKCEWGEVVAAGVSIWSFTCPDVRTVADEALPGFAREERGADGQVILIPAIRIFTKPADAPVSAVIDQVRALSPEAAGCEIEAGANGDFVLLPVGAAMEAYGRFQRGEADGPSMPCGPMGPSEAGGRTFRQIEGAPDKVAMIDWGTALPPFDPDTMRAAAN